MNNYFPAVPVPNNGPAMLALIAGTLFVAYGDKLGQQVGLVLIGAGITKLIS
jgi:hypothetical protein